MTDFLVVGIDGSGSHEWRRADGSNSHVFRFVHDIAARGRFKRYWHGPSTTGEETYGIVNTAYAWVERTLLQEGVVHRVAQPPSRFVPPTRIVAVEREPARLAICLVGHSRGGFAVIRLADRLRRLHVQVAFMGLYDAVDRTQGDGEVIYNVQFTAHARRDPRMNSRTSFGNDGLRSSGGLYVSETFMTSHGGVGGDPALHHDGQLDDLSCDVDTARAGIESMVGFDRGGMCVDGSRAADVFIRKRARSRGIRFYTDAPARTTSAP